MNGRFLPALSLVILVAGVANPRIAAPDPLPAEPPAPSVSPPVAPAPAEAYPAAIQTLLDRGGRLAGRGMVGDLPFWMIETPAGQQTYVTSPHGLVVQGQVYDSGGLLKLDTAAAGPVIVDPARQRREGLQPLLGETNTVLPLTAGLADGSPASASALDESLAAVETLVRGATGPEAVWADLGHATAIEEGARAAPLVYAFIDPYCPYCHQQWRLLRQAVVDGKLRVRWVSVVVLEASKRQLPRVLGLLPPTDAEGLARWMTHHVGEFRADAQAKLALARNQALFGRLQANKVPALLYRAADGRVILRAGLSPLAPATTAR